jgi:erythromycin esterase-like protein
LDKKNPATSDELFYIEQNARLVKNAEAYYRGMFAGAVKSWNMRDQHMTETLIAIMAHLERRTRIPKIVVWAHNSHIGDARATQMGQSGELNIGQLVREHFAHKAVNVGFTTFEGTVTAASDWDAPAERKRVLRGLAGSYEALLHDVGHARMLLLLEEPHIQAALSEARLERAIGVIYRPDTERVSHYFRASLPQQFDALIHIDRSRAVEPLERSTSWERPDVPETYPFAV